MEQKNINNNKYLLLAIIALIAFTVDAYLVVSGKSQNFDLDILDSVYSMRLPALTTAFETITSLGEWYTVVALTLLLIAFEKTRFSFGVPVAIMAASSSSINFAIKNIVQRPRPDAEMMLIEQGGYSFPSGHSVTSFAVYLMIAYLIIHYYSKWDKEKYKYVSKAKPLCILFIILPILIAFSRMYLGVHYLTDVVGGFFEASLLLCVFIGFILPKLELKHPEKFQ